MARRRILQMALALLACGVASPAGARAELEGIHKVQHVIAFATLAALGTFAYPRIALLRLLAGLSLFGAFIEVVQAIPALHRDSDVLDWLADTAAVAVVLALAWWWRRRMASG